MPVVESFNQPGVHGFLHRPERSAGICLLLTHGAGGNANSPLLVGVAEVLAGAGFHVLRCDLPFRQRRPHGPPHPSSAAADREGLRAAAAALIAAAPGRLVLGGQSYGGRQASLLASEDPAVASALLLLSYPLHPPGRPEIPRTAHFPALRIPALFVHGTRDPFASPEELREAIRLIPAPTRAIEIDGAGHDLAKGRFPIEASVLDPLAGLLNIRASPAL